MCAHVSWIHTLALGWSHVEMVGSGIWHPRLYRCSAHVAKENGRKADFSSSKHSQMDPEIYLFCWWMLCTTKFLHWLHLKGMACMGASVEGFPFAKLPGESFAFFAPVLEALNISINIKKNYLGCFWVANAMLLGCFWVGNAMLFEVEDLLIGCHADYNHQHTYIYILKSILK